MNLASKLGVATLMLWGVCAASAQQPNAHFWTNGDMPPGAIGSLQVQNGVPMSGYFQPVEIKGPKGISISLAEAGQFDESQEAPRKVGMQLGAVYRFRVTGIPRAEGYELYPTIEVVNRLYPPIGQELRFPVPIELTEEDLRLALAGKYVTRVIYLEDPRNAIPVSSVGQEQNWFDAAPKQDPLVVADALGRPMAILRMGGRVPTAEESVDPTFLYGSPKFLRYVSSASEKSYQRTQPPPLPRTQSVPQPQMQTKYSRETQPATASISMYRDAKVVRTSAETTISDVFRAEDVRAGRRLALDREASYAAPEPTISAATETPVAMPAKKMAVYDIDVALTQLASAKEKKSARAVEVITLNAEASGANREGVNVRINEPVKLLAPPPTSGIDLK